MTALLLYTSELGYPLKKAHEGDSGYDLYSSVDVGLWQGETARIPTGIRLRLPEGYEAQVRPTSGNSVKGDFKVTLGTVDNGYTGEVNVIVEAVRPLTTSIYRGQKLAQLVLIEIPKVSASMVSEDAFNAMNATSRGSNGFGSSEV